MTSLAAAPRHHGLPHAGLPRWRQLLGWLRRLRTLVRALSVTALTLILWAGATTPGCPGPGVAGPGGLGPAGTGGYVTVAPKARPTA